jgi:hypothetical protein
MVTRCPNCGMTYDAARIRHEPVVTRGRYWRACEWIELEREGQDA